MKYKQANEHGDKRIINAEGMGRNKLPAKSAQHGGYKPGDIVREVCHQGRI
ncbi:MAG: hypothetical protein GY850_43535 [bacterium]|nr:hypothetical protein [bacterium]